MRSTLLFIAVLLACSPMHAQATAPEGTRAAIIWLEAIFPAPAAESARRVAVKRRLAAPQSFARTLSVPVATVETAAAVQVVSPLLHAPNAP